MLRKASTCVSEKNIRRWLVDGADPNGVDERDGHNALLIAIQQGRKSVVEMLLEAGAKDALNSNGMNAAMSAAVYAQPEMLSMLLDKGFDLGAVDLHGRDALMLAFARRMPQSLESDVERLDLLLHRRDPMAVDIDGNTALMHACRSGASWRVVARLAAVSDPLRSNAKGQTALALAIARANIKAVEVLLPISDVFARDAHGRDLLDIARSPSQPGAMYQQPADVAMVSLVERYVEMRRESAELSASVANEAAPKKALRM